MNSKIMKVVAATFLSLASSIVGAGENISVAGVSFSVPQGWSVEQISGGVLLMAPDQENNWQANIFIESRADRERRPLKKALSDLAPNIKSRKSQYSELNREYQTLSNGISYGILEYSHEDHGTRLIDAEAIVENGGASRVMVLLSSEAGLISKYKPVFSAFLGSMSRH